MWWQWQWFQGREKNLPSKKTKTENQKKTRWRHKGCRHASRCLRASGTGGCLPAHHLTRLLLPRSTNWSKTLLVQQVLFTSCCSCVVTVALLLQTLPLLICPTISRTKVILITDKRIQTRTTVTMLNSVTTATLLVVKPPPKRTPPRISNS